MPLDSLQFVKWFRAASPYIHVHRGKTFVIQFDDDAIQCGTFSNLVHDLALLNSLSIQLVLVFGTRRTIEKQLAENKLKSRYHKGLRVTDAAAMEIVKAAAGRLRIDIESSLSLGLGNTPMSHAELRVTSGNFVMAKPLGVIDGVDYRFTGEVRHIDVDSIRMKLVTNEIVLIAPLGYSLTGEAFNLNATTLAARLATELQADKLIYLMEAEGLTDAGGQLIHQLTQPGAEALLAGTSEKMPAYRYIKSAVQAGKAGVERVHLLDRRLDGAILQELFTRDGTGTMISMASYDVIREAGIDDIAGILELIEPLEKQGVLVERSRERLELEINHFTVLERDGVIIGCAALYLFKREKAAELACLVVHPDYHNGGRGNQLLGAMEEKSKRAKVKQLYVLTTHAEHWFLERGFNRTTLGSLPVKRKIFYNYQRKSKVLVKKIG
ncbi:MAG: amino-acid N-acetyltransferase [Gammaproteobacteria bacterium]